MSKNASKDTILQKFMRSWKFLRMSRPEQMFELREYKYQKDNFQEVTK